MICKFGVCKIDNCESVCRKCKCGVCKIDNCEYVENEMILRRNRFKYSEYIT